MVAERRINTACVSEPAYGQPASLSLVVQQGWLTVDDRLDELLRKWGQAQVELDWETHAALISARVAEPSGDDDRRNVEGLLRRFGESAPELDEDRFVKNVMARVAPAVRVRSHRTLVFRIGGLLAAAAAVAFVVTGGLWSIRPKEAIVQVSIGPMASTSIEVSGAVRVAVAVFDRASKPAAMRMEGESLSFLAIGPAPASRWDEQVPPL